MFSRELKIHFVGIGGIGMSGIAEVLLSMGFEVSGSDVRKTAVTDRLASLGAHIHVGHNKNNVTNVDVVVVSSAINNQNPELAEAAARKIPVVHRSEMLAELMRLKQGIAVSGTHGKTTTTSLLAASLIHAGVDPTCIIGGRLNSVGSNAQVGSSDFFVAEADESDGSFLRLSPTIAVVTNIDLDHMDHYPNFESIQNAFFSFLDKVPFYGSICACIDDLGVVQILPRLRKKIITYGFDMDADITAVHVRPDEFSMRFHPRIYGQTMPEVRLKMPGRYNVSNALASYAVASFLKLDLEKVSEAISSFEGVLHRFTILGESHGVTVVDDYAHNPKKIESVLDGVREAFSDRFICAVFQPHRYSRLSSLWNDFVKSFHSADAVIVTPVYAASETPIEGINAQAIAKAIQGPKVVTPSESLADAANIAVHQLQKNKGKKGAVVITLGAGDISTVGTEVLKLLSKEST